jgi:hypothetical protein
MLRTCVDLDKIINRPTEYLKVTNRGQVHNRVPFLAGCVVFEEGAQLAFQNLSGDAALVISLV